MSGAIQQEPKSASPFWLVYGQITAMLSAFSLLVFLSHFVDTGLKGVIREAFEGWALYVRPTLSYPFQLFLDLIPEDFRFKLEPIHKDYLAVGVITAASLFRVLPDGEDGMRKRRPLYVAFALLVAILTWPVFVVGGCWHFD